MQPTQTMLFLYCLAFPLFCPSPLDADILTPELLHTAHSRRQHGLVIAWLTVEWPDNIIPISETFTLLQTTYSFNITLLQITLWLIDFSEIPLRPLFKSNEETCNLLDSVLIIMRKPLEQQTLIHGSTLPTCLFIHEANRKQVPRSVL